jgi:hypothetical protein
MSETVREFGHVDGPATAGAIPPGHPSAPPAEPDPDTVGIAELDDLEQLREDLGREVELPEVTLPVGTRPGYAVRYRTDVSQGQLDAWRKAAKDRRRADGFAGERFASLILANTCQAIVRGGRVVTEDGEPVTFRSREFLDLTGVNRAADAVQKFYGADAHVDSAARSVLLEAGWGDDVIATLDDEQGPTRSGRG